MAGVGRGPLFWFVGLKSVALSLRVQFECGDVADCCSTLVLLCSKYSMLENHFISKKRFSRDRWETESPRMRFRILALNRVPTLPLMHQRLSRYGCKSKASA